MGQYQDLTKNTPWESFGRETVASRISRSLLPVGVLPFQPLPYSADTPSLYVEDLAVENYMLHIIGTAIQSDEGKLVTCAHVVEALKGQTSSSYLIARTFQGNTVRYQPYPLQNVIPYYDPRTDQPNPSVDLSALILPVVRTKEHPYEGLS
ncbi:MAG TPA: hypothetical protein VE843_07705 [Ktedonobacteraceae bacterium]|nr:hypothetical protein [Ktedonobacteraceae bacterium]